MSLNNSLNACISLIEGKPDLCRSFFRDPNSDIKDIGAATSRLYTALDKHTAHEIRSLLVKILSIQEIPGNGLLYATNNPHQVFTEGFYEGVRSVENLLGEYLKKLEDQ
jgi:hypothetical protein